MKRKWEANSAFYYSVSRANTSLSSSTVRKYQVPVGAVSAPDLKLASAHRWLSLRLWVKARHLGGGLDPKPYKLSIDVSPRNMNLKALNFRGLDSCVMGLAQQAYKNCEQINGHLQFVSVKCESLPAEYLWPVGTY